MSLLADFPRIDTITSRKSGTVRFHHSRKRFSRLRPLAHGTQTAHLYVIKFIPAGEVIVMTGINKPIALCFAAIVGASSAVAEDLPKDPVAIKNGASGLCLDISQESQAEGAGIVQSECKDGDSRLWRIEQTENGYRIVNKNSNLCLDVRGGSRANGTPTIQATCNDTADQLWRIAPSSSGNSLANVKSNLCLNVPNSVRRPGIAIVQWPCRTSAGQSWSW